MPAQHLQGIGAAVDGVARVEEEADELGIGLREEAIDLVRRLHERPRVVVHDHAHAQLVAQRTRDGFQRGHRLPPLPVVEAGAAVLRDAPGAGRPRGVLVVGHDQLAHALGGEEARDVEGAAHRGRTAPRILEREGHEGRAQGQAVRTQRALQRTRGRGQVPVGPDRQEANEVGAKIEARVDGRLHQDRHDEQRPRDGAAGEQRTVDQTGIDSHFDSPPANLVGLTSMGSRLSASRPAVVGRAGGRFFGSSSRRS